MFSGRYTGYYNDGGLVRLGAGSGTATGHVSRDTGASITGFTAGRQYRTHNACSFMYRRSIPPNTHGTAHTNKFTRRMDPPLHGFLESDFLAFFPSHCPYTLHMYSSLCSGYLSVGSSVQPFGQSP